MKNRGKRGDGKVIPKTVDAITTPPEQEGIAATDSFSSVVEEVMDRFSGEGEKDK